MNRFESDTALIASEAASSRRISTSDLFYVMRPTTLAGMGMIYALAFAAAEQRVQQLNQLRLIHSFDARAGMN